MSKILSEHLGYFRLRGRTDLYRRAINSVVQDGDTVADLGCGFGLLGLLALEAGASRIWGIDSSLAIHVARETMHRAGLGERYTCLAESTFSAELPAPVDVLVCDHVGFFGFDYGIIAMMEDARRRLLKPGGRVVPDRVDLYVAPVTGARARKKADGWAADSIPSQFQWLGEYQRNACHPVNFSPEDLAGGAQELGSIPLDRDIDTQLKFETVLTIDRDTTIEGIAGWFDCHLGGGIRMSNSPVSEDSIRRSNAFLPLNHAIEAPNGGAIRFSLRLNTEQTFMSWEIEPDWEEPRQMMTNFKSQVFARSDLARSDFARSDIARSERATDADDTPTLSPLGKAAAFVLSCADGEKTFDQISALTRDAFAGTFEGEDAARDFVRRTLAGGRS